VKGVLCAIVVALAVVGCGKGDEPGRPPSEVSASGFTTQRPKGFSGVGSGAVAGTVLGLLGPLDQGAGSAPAISVSRSPVPPDTSPGALRKLVVQQSRPQGARQLRRLPERLIDGEPAVGVRFRATASNRTQTTRRTYAVRHRGFVYTIASTAPGRSAREQPLAVVLDNWRWAP